MFTSITRVLRTPHSERYLFQTAEGDDCAALDLHYLPNGSVHGTLVILEGMGLDEDSVPAVLKTVDERLLPEVSMEERNLTFTVVMGRVLGTYSPQPD